MEKRKNKKWSEMTLKEKKRAKINLFLFSFIILIFIFIGVITCSGPSQEETYITGPDPDDITSKLESESYRTQILSAYNTYWSSFQPKISYGDSFTDRIQIYSNKIDKISAIRVESMTLDKNFSLDNHAKQHFYWIGSLLHYPINITRWIKSNINRGNDSIMLDKYTILRISSPDKTCRRMDIFKVNDNNTTSPIPDDQLFEH